MARTPGAENGRGFLQAPVLTVSKLDLAGRVTWQYTGRLLHRSPHRIVLEAWFDRDDRPFLDLVLKQGDRFVETYYDDRGYNLYEIFDRDTRTLKGWYCNLSRPASFTASGLSWVDLALDLWVWPDGRRAVLDEDEFEALPLEAAERRHVRNVLLALEQAFDANRPPP